MLIGSRPLRQLCGIKTTSFTHNQHAMKNQMLTLILLSIVFPLFLSAQWTMPLGSMKKNGLGLGFTHDKELRFGYERLLSPRSSLNFTLGYGFQNLDSKVSTKGEKVIVTTFPREVQNETVWVFIFPQFSTKASVQLPPTYETKNRGRYLVGSLNFYGEYKHFFGGNPQHKIQNGFYLAPGLSIGSQRFTNYTFFSGRKNEIQELGRRSITVGIPPLAGGITTIYDQSVSVVDYKEVKKDHVNEIYLRPHLGAGWQFPIGSLFSLDLGGRVFWSNEEFDPELKPEDPKAIASIRGAATGRLSIWF